ncbi:MAG: OmpA family protein [Rhodocyclales bacterium]|nr:OmpA family protein [Rhodocyclales bacterium]
MKPKSISIRTVIASLAGAAAMSASAQVVNNDAYLIDQRGVVARSGFGLCWRTAEWTPAKAIAECDPDLVKPAPAPVPAPVVVAPPPPPAPKPVPLPPPPPPKCDFGAALAADTTFGFGKAGLSDSAKGQLDAIAKDAMGRCGKVTSVRVVGHTDRIGSVAGNQKLSEQRARDVVSYLQAKGLKADSFEAVGMGKSQPLASVVCSDKLAKAKLVECLAPNRRVTVEIKGVGK